MAREMAVPLGARAGRGGANDPRTVQSYVELLAVNYFALVLYFWKQDSGSGDVAKDKKVYFGDPLLQHRRGAGRAAARPTRRCGEAVALALYRRYEPRSAAPRTSSRPSGCMSGERAGAGRSTSSAGRAEQIDAVEVADWARVDRRKATAPTRALPGRPSLVASREELEFGRSANLVPAALTLWALSR